MACVGAAPGLSCTDRALGTSGATRRNWQLTAASALGTGMYAATEDVAPSAQPLSGATAMRFVFPFPVGLGSYVILTAAFVALSRAARDQAARGGRESRRQGPRPTGPAPCPGRNSPGVHGPHARVRFVTR
ncbi:hypothetical protein AB0H29_21835 [Streptomyces thermolilacinus]